VAARAVFSYTYTPLGSRLSCWGVWGSLELQS
jgi:hypothetical protein